MTWKEFNADVMGRLLNGGIAVSALAGIFIAFSTEAALSNYVMMIAVLITMVCGIASIGLAANYARRQALILIFVLPLAAQIFFAWSRVTESTTDMFAGVIMVIAAAIFTFLALFPPKPTGDETPPAAPPVEASH